jgi:hypothetical protein
MQWSIASAFGSGTESVPEIGDIEPQSRAIRTASASKPVSARGKRPALRTLFPSKRIRTGAALPAKHGAEGIEFMLHCGILPIQL